MAFIDCPDCDTTFVDTSASCPKCGRASTNAPRPKGKPSSNIIFACIATVGLLYILVVDLGSGFFGPSVIEGSPTIVETRCELMECKLASIELQRVAGPQDPMVSAMRSRLAALDAIYPENAEQIGDMTVAVQNSLAKSGQHVPLSTIMSSLGALPRVSAALPGYADAAAMYGTLRQKGFSNDSAVAGLSAMIRDLGRLR
jgi:hypothetical protein